jgi:hypothetical protein
MAVRRGKLLLHFYLHFRLCLDFAVILYGFTVT